MKFTPSLFITGFFISISSLLFSQSININKAKEIAKNHLLIVSKNNLKSASPNQAKIKFSALSVTSDSKDTLYFVLNDTINHSFVIVAADERSTPILGYSLEGNYSEKNQPPAFVEWMENRKQEITYIKQNSLQPDSIISQQWDNLSSSNSHNTNETTSVEPLLHTKWDQGCYYNEKCPVPQISLYCGHVPTGCVATSMAQIMKYWNYPTTGTGSHSYLSAGYGILSADFGSTTYQWSQMPNELTSENDAVATLMYQCGVALDMIYTPSESGSYDPRDELIKYFNYSSMAEYVDKRSFLPGDWVSLLKSELEYGRPIWYNGAKSLCGGGHAFVCDGYRDDDYFHFNWGWGGAFDGYFYLESLNPGSYNFSIFQAAIIKIFPKNLPDGYQGVMLSTKTVGIGISGGTSTLEINSSADWTATFDQAWLSIRTAGETAGNSTISLTAMPNPNATSRKATVTISATGFQSQIISVIQYGKTEISAGNLKISLGDQISSITHLTLNGTIDASDFRTMRDEMPALTEIDLSGVRVTSYTGANGTIGDESYDYPADGIPNFAFLFPKSNRAKTRLKSVILPSSITKINDYAFQSCDNLNIGAIPSTVTSIGNGAFLGCSRVDSLIIPSSVTFIGDFAFNSFKGAINVDAENPNYSAIDGVLFNKDQTLLMQCPISKTGNYTIPSSVKTIRYQAFYGCIGITNLTIPSSVKSIEDYAFNYCTGLSTINIPSSVTSIGQRAFGGFKGSITVDPNNPNYSATEGVLFNKDQTELIQCPVSKAGIYSIPSTVKTVKAEAFNSCVDIASIIIPSSVKNIGSLSFNCRGLSSIYAYQVPPIDLNSSCFAFCEVDTTACSLYVPYGTKALYAAANQWRGFTKVVEMPGLFVSDKAIDLRMNGDTASLYISCNTKWTVSSNQSWLTLNKKAGDEGYHEVIISAPVNQTMSSRRAIVSISAEGLPTQTLEVTQYAKVEVTAGSLKMILSGKSIGVKSLNLSGIIDARDFKTMRDEMPSLTEINLSNVTIAEYTGTEGTGGIYNITYPANAVPYMAFYNVYISVGKSSLKSITLPSSLISIGSYAFGRCNGLNTIKIPSSVASIGYQAFIYFKGTITVEAENSNYSSKDSILFNKDQTNLIQCPTSKAGSYTIPSTVKTIEDYAFSECLDLTSITIPSSVNSFGQGVFSYCSGLTSINIPSSITILTQGSFFWCRKLTSITIPSSVTSIRDCAFSGCDGLSSIYVYSSTPIDLDNSIEVFNSVNKNSCTLYVPIGTKSLYSIANQWKDFKNIEEGNTIGNVGITDPLIINKRFEVYPNPTSGKIKINCNEVLSDQDEIFITDINGKTIYKGKLKREEDWIDISGNMPGIYFLRISSDPKTAKRIILVD